MKRNRSFVNAFLLLAIAAVASFAQNDGDKSGSSENTKRRVRVRAFEVKIENLTPVNPNMMSGQPFSPPVLVAHNNNVRLWNVGQPASFGLMRIAEEGNLGPLSTAVIVPNQGILFGEEKILPSILPGQERTAIIYVDERFPLFSAVWMLVRTNDGFSGINAVNLFQFGRNESRVYETPSFDAGTEINNELNPFLIAREGTNRAPENGVVTTPHPSIRGDADAPASWNFEDPVARVTIRALGRGVIFPGDYFTDSQKILAAPPAENTPDNR